mmetsp:Transcript_23816/g.80343  ORF Transcript_23816/g.80343 Transcript_23816/m.80343 type:complete len:260 (-) Transcript_23816:2930-3709(-)
MPWRTSRVRASSDLRVVTSSARSSLCARSSALSARRARASSRAARWNTPSRLAVFVAAWTWFSTASSSMRCGGIKARGGECACLDSVDARARSRSADASWESSEAARSSRRAFCNDSSSRRCSTSKSRTSLFCTAPVAAACRACDRCSCWRKSSNSESIRRSAACLSAARRSATACSASARAASRRASCTCRSRDRRRSAVPASPRRDACEADKSSSRSKASSRSAPAFCKASSAAASAASSLRLSRSRSHRAASRSSR